MHCPGLPFGIIPPCNYLNFNFSNEYYYFWYKNNKQVSDIIPKEMILPSFSKNVRQLTKEYIKLK